MQDNPSTDHTDNTDNTDHPTQPYEMDRDDWELALEPFNGEPYAALKLGFNFALMRKELDTQLFKSQPVMEALDLAMEVLFAYTDFHDVSLNLFLKFTEGKLTFQEQEMLNALGVKI